MDAPCLNQDILNIMVSSNAIGLGAQTIPLSTQWRIEVNLKGQRHLNYLIMIYI